MPANPQLMIPASVETVAGHTFPVTVSDLCDRRCRIMRPLAVSLLGMSIQLWLGAIGPLRAHLSPYARTLLLFDYPIHRAVVAHFNV